MQDFGVLGGPKATRALLIHFRTRCHAVDRKHQKLSRPDHVDDAVRVLEHFDHHVLLRFRRRLAFRMRTWMHDAVHI